MRLPLEERNSSDRPFRPLCAFGARLGINWGPLILIDVTKGSVKENRIAPVSNGACRASPSDSYPGPKSFRFPATSETITK